MKVFLSWSGDISRSMAEALREWLPSVIQAVKPWMSSEDIGKGARWSADIAAELNSTKVGIICLTPDNVNAPWVNFEAGALSRVVDKAYVCPYLWGLEPSDLDGPLVQFQATVVTKEDTRRLVGTINAALEDKALSEASLNKAFELWWPDFWGKVQGLSIVKMAPRIERSEREVLEEILELVRQLVRQGDEIGLPEKDLLPGFIPLVSANKNRIQVLKYLSETMKIRDDLARAFTVYSTSSGDEGSEDI